MFYYVHNVGTQEAHTENLCCRVLASVDTGTSKAAKRPRLLEASDEPLPSCSFMWCTPASASEGASFWELSGLPVIASLFEL